MSAALRSGADGLQTHLVCFYILIMCKSKSVPKQEVYQGFILRPSLIPHGKSVAAVATCQFSSTI